MGSAGKTFRMEKQELAQELRVIKAGTGTKDRNRYEGNMDHRGRN